jgi:hypothetical protein
MKRLCTIALAGALAITLGTLPLAAAQEKEKEPQKQETAPLRVYDNRYEIRFLDLHSAEQLAWDLCSFRDSCRVTAASVEGKPGGILAVGADAKTHEKLARELAKRDVAPKTQVFQVILLAANTKAGASPKDLSAGAQKAISDLHGFLPYKSYELLDSTVIPATREALATGRLVGRDGVAYNIRLGFRPSGPDGGGEIFVSRFNLNEEAGTTPLVPTTPNSASMEHRAPRGLFDTTFSLKPGETIVVGTSHLDGSGDALVTLLTALP